MTVVRLMLVPTSALHQSVWALVLQPGPYFFLHSAQLIADPLAAKDLFADPLAAFTLLTY